MSPGFGRTLGSLGFRHDNAMVVSYIDGHVRPFEYAELDDWAIFGEAEPTGEFLIQFTPAQSCNGTYIHTLPPMVVE